MIYIHIPKTAGTYVEQYLNKNKIKHTYYCHKFIMFDDNLRLNNEIFTTIRDPIQRMVSTYFYSIKCLNNNSWYKQSNETAKQTHFKIKELYKNTILKMFMITLTIMNTFMVKFIKKLIIMKKYIHYKIIIICSIITAVYFIHNIYT